MKPESNKEIKVPNQIKADIKDMIDPIVVRRRTMAKVGVLAAALLVAGFLSWQLFFAPPSGEELLAQVVAAAGGMENWNSIEQGTYTRVRTVFDENGQPIEELPAVYSFRKGSDYRLLIETTNEQGPIEIGFDGRDYWAVQNGEPVDPVQLARKQGYMCDSDQCTPLCSAEMSFYRFSIPFKMTDPGVIPKVIGAAVLNGSPVSLLEITFEPEIGRDRWVLFVDDETKLIHKIEHYARVSSDVPPEEIYWSDHTTEFGITFSHRNTYYRSNGKKLEEFRITDVDFNSPIPDEKFQKPGAWAVQ
ncbi:MAG: hypothetical protein ACE5IY_18485 [bacterium]